MTEIQLEIRLIGLIEDCLVSAMILEKKQNSFNKKVAVLADYEVKVTELMGWAIDAPVENNLGIVPVAKALPLRKPINQLRGDAVKIAIT